jgi:hypothetical protein
MRVAVDDLSDRPDADGGVSFVSGSCGDANALALTSAGDDAFDNVPKNEQID